jgi:hypothetical protein
MLTFLYLVGVGINYVHIEDRFETENYCKIPLRFTHRSAFAKFRCGVAPLRIETGRYENLRLNERMCSVCSGEVEDEAHVLFWCPLYSTFRDHLFNIACTFNGFFLSFNDNQKLVFLFSDFNIRICAKTCNLIFKWKKKCYIL